ncbi:MAG: butyrate kinase [candidate division KSB1 bacterium]|nr:butyrate kinase [candidate division KSB1 bacterium]
MSTHPSFSILVINPGSTSSKLALFENTTPIIENSITHPANSGKADIWSEYTDRLSEIQTFLQEQNIKTPDAVVGRGGLLKPVKRGTYAVNQAMIQDARANVQGEHVSNLGCVLARDMARSYDCPAFVVDPVSVDEFEPVSRLSGHPAFERKCLSHALNLRAAAFWAAEKVNKQIDGTRFVGLHLGGGISVASLVGGRIIDVNDASNSGPFSPQRSGSLPTQPLVRFCFTGEHDQASVLSMINGRGGVYAYLGTSDMKKVQGQRHDPNVRLIWDAMIYQIAKETGAAAAALKGDVDAVFLTGGLVHSKLFVSELCAYIKFIAPVLTCPGELEMQAMASGALRVLLNKEPVKIYE